MYSITKQFLTWLTSQGYTVHTYPPKTGNEFVTIERTGGYVENKIDHPEIAIQTWAQSEARAEEMALNIRNALLLGSLPDGVYRVDVNAGPYPFYDEDTRLPRYQIVFDCTTYLID